MCSVCDANHVLKQPRQVVWENVRMTQYPADFDAQVPSNPRRRAEYYRRRRDKINRASPWAPVQAAFYAIPQEGEGAEGCPCLILVQRRTAEARGPAKLYEVADLAGFMHTLGTDMPFYSRGEEAQAWWTSLDAPDPEKLPKPVAVEGRADEQLVLDTIQLIEGALNPACK
jgi:hypothetical protein